VRRSSERERQQLHETFTTLCRIESPSRHERRCADWVSAQLRQLGLEVSEDGAGERAGSDAGNLLTRVPGRGPDSILLSAHLDTVPLTAPVEPVLVDGGFENANQGILGADNKSAVAIMLELARRLASAPEPPETGLELLFTVCEEVGLAGSREFDCARLRSRFGYVFDHATPVGEIVLASPTQYIITAELTGRAAHAGVRPEAGRNAIVAAAKGIAAMRLGRLDEGTTANLGTIRGGTATNVVAEHCVLEAEARSLDHDTVEALVTEMVDHLGDAANAAECDLDLTVEQVFKGYRTRRSAPQVVLAERALRACGYEPRHISTGGASDANSLEAQGFPCTNLADGTQRNHQPDERISLDALDGMFDVAIVLLEEAASVT
jgi:tripeptide aminopeptidase